MARTGHDVHMAVAQPLSCIAHGADAGLIEGGRVELADDLARKLQPDVCAQLWCAVVEFRHHRVQLIQQMRAHIDGEDHLTGDHVATVGVDVDVADGTHGVGLVFHRDLVHQLGHQRQPAPCISAHMHGGRPRVAFLAGHRAFDPAQALTVGDDADILPLGLQNRALFDVQLEEGMHLARADFFVAFPADPVQLIAKLFAVRICPVARPVKVMLARKHAGGQHCGGKARALFVGPVGDHNRVLGLDVEVIHRADNLKPAQNAQYPVVFAARRLGVQVRSHVNGQGVGVRALTACKHIADLIHAHGAACVLAPALEQMAALAVCVGQGLAVVATGDTGADLGHLHQAVPQAGPVDA